jgi:hypothetical protein
MEIGGQCDWRGRGKANVIEWRSIRAPGQLGATRRAEREGIPPELERDAEQGATEVQALERGVRAALVDRTAHPHRANQLVPVARTGFDVGPRGCSRAGLAFMARTGKCKRPRYGAVTIRSRVRAISAIPEADTPEQTVQRSDPPAVLVLRGHHFETSRLSAESFDIFWRLA